MTGPHRSPPVPGTSRSAEGDPVPTGSQPWNTPPLRGVTSGDRSPATEPTWTPPTPNTAPRLWPAWQTLLRHLADGEWHTRTTTIEAMIRHSDIQPKTATNIIGSAATHGYIERRNRHKHYEDRLTPLGLELTPEPR